MMADKKTKRRRSRTARILAIPIFCGVFSFCHWFIFFPLMWKYLSNHGMEKFWLFALVVFFMWLVVMALCLCCWWYDKKRLTPVEEGVEAFKYESDVDSGGPSFKTKSCVVQPDSNGKYSGEDAERESLCTRGIPVQPQNTPALYNLHTGRRSYDSGDVRNSSDSFQNSSRMSEQFTREVLLIKKENNLKFKNISSSDSEKSSKVALDEHPVGFESQFITEIEKTPIEQEKSNHTVQAVIEQPLHHQRDIQIRTKYDRCAVAQKPTKVRLSSDSDENDELFKHIDMDIRLSDERINKHVNKPGDIQHVQESNTPNPDRLSENMPEFDDYLHLVSIDTPLSPREIFFSDLIKQANKTEQKLLQAKEGGGDRRSYCIGDITYNKLNYDHRKSVPLFLYSDQWRREGQSVEGEEVPEQTVDSDGDQEPDRVVDKPNQDIEHKRQLERKGTDLKIVEMNQKKTDCDDLKMVTQTFINAERLKSYQPHIAKQPPVVMKKPNLNQETKLSTITAKPNVCENKPVNKDNEDLKIITQMLINEEKLKSCASPYVAKPGLKRETEPMDSTHKPRFPQNKPLKLTESISGQAREPKAKPSTERKEVVEPEIERSRARSGCCEDEPGVRKPNETAGRMENKRKSSSEYFIADVEPRAPQSVTSQVFLTVGASGLLTDVPEHPRQAGDVPRARPGSGVRDLGQWSSQGMSRELSQDKLEYRSEDDDVFEDVQEALTKLRRHK